MFVWVVWSAATVSTRRDDPPNTSAPDAEAGHSQRTAQKQRRPKAAWSYRIAAGRVLLNFRLSAQILLERLRLFLLNLLDELVVAHLRVGIARRVLLDEISDERAQHDRLLGDGDLGLHVGARRNAFARGFLHENLAIDELVAHGLMQQRRILLASRGVLRDNGLRRRLPYDQSAPISRTDHLHRQSRRRALRAVRHDLRTARRHAAGT